MPGIARAVRWTPSSFHPSDFPNQGDGVPVPLTSAARSTGGSTEINDAMKIREMVSKGILSFSKSVPLSEAAAAYQGRLHVWETWDP